LGLAKEALGDLSGALDALNRAVTLNPRSFDVWHKKASLRLKVGDSRGALDDVDRALSLNPKSAELLEMRKRLQGSRNGF
jgi:tetratricopeptide (TPR) repeat protein